MNTDNLTINFLNNHTMKKILRWSLPLLAGLLMWNCSDTVKDHYQVIPRDAFVVVSIHAEQLKEKSGVKEVLEPLLQEMTGSEPSMKQVMAVLNDSKESGLDLEKELLFFSRAEELSFGCVARIHNSNKLNSVFNILADEGLVSKVKAKGDLYTSTVDGGDAVFIFDKYHLLLIPSLRNEDTFEYGKTLLNQSKENSILSVEEFTKNRTKDDVSTFLSMKPLLEGMDNLSFTHIHPENFHLLMGLNFENGVIRLTNEFFTTDPVNLEFLKQVSKITSKFPRAQMEFFPETTLLFVTGNINGPAYVDLLEKQWESLMKSPLIMTESDLEAFEEMKAFVTPLVSSLNGEITVGTTGVNMLGIPSLALYAEVSDNSIVQLLTEVLPKMDYVRRVTPVSENNYKVELGMLGIPVYYGINNKLFYLTTDASIAANPAQKTEKSLKHSVLAEQIPANAHCYMGLNLESILQIPMLGMLMQAAGYDSDLLSLLSLAKYLEIYNEGATKMTLKLHIGNENENALRTLVNTANLFL